MSVPRLDVVVFAGHSHFYVSDAGPWDGHDDANADDEMLWRGAAGEIHLDVRPRWFAVLTKTQGYVRVVIETSAEEPEANVTDHDHVVDAAIENRSGKLVVIEETAEIGRLTVPPGAYRARVCWDGLDRVAKDDSNEEDPAETVRIELWPGARIEPRVRKWYWEWKPKPPEKRPENPHGLRVLVGEREIELALPPYPFTRVVGHHRRPDGTTTGLIVDPDGNFWESVYSEEPPYEEILFEIPPAETERFERF